MVLIDCNQHFCNNGKLCLVAATGSGHRADFRRQRTAKFGNVRSWSPIFASSVKSAAQPHTGGDDLNHSGHMKVHRNRACPVSMNVLTARIQCAAFGVVPEKSDERCLNQWRHNVRRRFCSVCEYSYTVYWFWVSCIQVWTTDAPLEFKIFRNSALWLIAPFSLYMYRFWFYFISRRKRTEPRESKRDAHSKSSILEKFARTNHRS